MKNLICAVLCISLIVGLVGCTCPPKAAPAPAPKPAAKPEPKPAPAPAPKAGTCGNYTITEDYLRSGAIRLEKVMPAMVQLNAPFEYTINVTNLTDVMLSEIEVKDRIPASFKYASSTPACKQEGNVLVWKMDSLGPKAAETIVIKGTAAEMGCLQTCASVTYIVPACAKTEVVQPALALTKSAPANVLICDPIPLTFTVTNKGTGTAANVKLSDKLPDGLTTQDGKISIDLTLGNLAPNQSVSRTINTKASKTGTYKNQATAMADGDLKAQSEVTSTVVAQPVLAITKTGPKKIYIGRSMQYEITVTNNGDVAAANTVVTDTIPAGVTEVKASDNGAAAGTQVTWNLGSLAPKASKKLMVSYKPSAGGEFKNIAKATAVCAEAVSASAATGVEGIPAVLLEVIDVSDPIEVGSNETYIITVTNQGSASDTNIAVKAMLEESMEYVSSSGATTGSAANGTVTFAPLPSLAPKAKATWQVIVKAKKAGDVRFSVTLDTDQLDRNVEETEATNFYE